MAYYIKDKETGEFMELWIQHGGLEYTDDEGEDHYIMDEIMITPSNEWMSSFSDYNAAYDKLSRYCRSSDGNYIKEDYEIVEVL